MNTDSVREARLGLEVLVALVRGKGEGEGDGGLLPTAGSLTLALAEAIRLVALERQEAEVQRVTLPRVSVVPPSRPPLPSGG